MLVVTYEFGTALREEIAAHFVVLSRDGHAHGFQPVHPRGAIAPVAWTYRTGYGPDVRSGWVLTGGRLRTEHAAAVYRWQAEEDAASTFLTLTARGEGDISVVDALGGLVDGRNRTEVRTGRDVKAPREPRCLW
ncbi:hypothetical protein ABZ599_15445 [Streptomyces misionensis]|uniref:hypothetical protein n=1 Tax=Streptomyces misionensis TaxID=67331 RepID=UPI0034104BB3